MRAALDTIITRFDCPYCYCSITASLYGHSGFYIKGWVFNKYYLKNKNPTVLIHSMLIQGFVFWCRFDMLLWWFSEFPSKLPQCCTCMMLFNTSSMFLWCSSNSFLIILWWSVQTSLRLLWCSIHDLWYFFNAPSMLHKMMGLFDSNNASERLFMRQKDCFISQACHFP